jgi:dTDP-4-dehydrorhamnose reductase
VHCSAFTAVDRAEDEPALCERVNAEGSANLAIAAKEVGAKMMYISTDYVFPGDGDRFYQPEDPTGPLSVYGKTKYMGEESVRNTLERHFILRISWVFGINGNNFVKTMLRLAETKTDLNVVCDQIGSPTYTKDLARLICDMIVTERYGTYHATNEGICSWADFAAEIMKQAGKSTVIHPIPSSQYPTKAHRPLNSRMSKDKLEEAGFERLPHWQDALARYLTELTQA